MKISKNNVKNFLKDSALGVIRIACYMLLFFYVLFGAISTHGWGHTTWQRHYPVETLYERVAAARKNNDLAKAIGIVVARKISESQEVLDILLPHAAQFEPSFFFEFSRRYVILDNPPEAIFWAQLGRLRLRFDFLRCNNMLSKEMSDNFVGFFSPDEVDAYLDLYPEDLMPALKRVLEWDEKNPPPREMLFDCTLLTKLSPNTAGEPLPEENWDFVRAALRRAGEKFLKEEALDKK